jgi:hypothetical protein
MRIVFSGLYECSFLISILIILETGMINAWDYSLKPILVMVFTFIILILFINQYGKLYKLIYHKDKFIAKRLFSKSIEFNANDIIRIDGYNQKPPMANIILEENRIIRIKLPFWIWWKRLKEDKEEREPLKSYFVSKVKDKYSKRTIRINRF